jgi:hypothetical protein
MSTTQQTPEQRAAEQKARKAAIVNPNPRQDPIRAPLSSQAPIAPNHLAQALEAESLRQAFLALPADQQRNVLLHAQALADAQAAQQQQTARTVRKVVTTGAALVALGSLGHILYGATECPKVN